jgi:enoyl-CoA hydratase
MAFDNLLVERDQAVVLLTINRPQVLNALNTETLERLRTVLLEVKQDREVRVVVLTGAGEKSFVAGADINELAEQTPTSARDHARAGQQVLDLIENLGKPVIAAINGFALGGGCELAMACTIRLAADTAKLGQPEINLGIMPGYGGTQRLARLVGRGRALEMLLTGTLIDAAQAERVGLVNKVVPAAELRTATKNLATELATRAPAAVRGILDAVNGGLDVPLAEGCRLEASLFALVAATEDMREGTRAFLEKRKPEFKGR